MTPIELIEDTVNYYKNHPRAININGQCAYLCKETKDMCAVGRWINWEKAKGKENEIEMTGSFENNPDFIKDYLMNEVKEIPDTLWARLQTYHDVVLLKDKIYQETYLDKIKSYY